MKKKVLLMFMLLASVLIPNKILAQAQVLSTTSVFLNNNGTGTATFNLENTNPYPIIITDIAGITGTTGSVTVEMYFKTTPVNGSPGNISAANGWNLVSTAVITGVGNTTTTTTQPFLSNVGFVIPANTTYGIAVFATGQRYFTLPAGTTTVSSSGLNLITGDNIGYAGGTPPTTPTNSPRGWIGDITFTPAPACTGTPNPGNTIAPSLVCASQSFQLSMQNHVADSGVVFQWQSAPTISGPWTNISGANNIFANVSHTSNTAYRCEVTCTVTNQSATSTPALVNTNPNLAAGTYTIGSNGDFSTFNAAVAAMNCGIAGPVIFNVLPGVYNEQVIIPNIINASATNTITFNGVDTASRRITFNSTVSADRHTIRLDGAKFIRIKNLTIENTSTTNAYVVHMTNGCFDIEISGNQVMVNSSTSPTTAFGCIIASGSNTSATGTGHSVKKIKIENNKILNGYYGIALTGIAADRISDAVVQNNDILNSFYFGVNLTQTSVPSILGNRILMNPLGNNSAEGINISTSDGPFNFSNNIITNPGIYGIYISGVTATALNPSLIINNSIGGGFRGTSNLNGGIRMIGTMAHVKIWYNTINFDNGPGSALNIRVSTVTDLDIRNNNFSYTGGSNGYAMYLNATTLANTLNYNNYFSNGSTFVYVGSNLANLAALQALNTPSGNDMNSVSGNSLFTSSTNLFPLGAVLNNAATPIASVTNDVMGIIRSATTPDIGAYEHTPVQGDIALIDGIFDRKGACYNTNDTIVLTIKNNIGNTINFSVNPLTAIWTVTGPQNSNGTIVVNSGTLAVGSTMALSAFTANLTTPGTYTLNAFIQPNAVNESALNDTLAIPAIEIVEEIFSVSPVTAFLTSPTATAVLNAKSPLITNNKFFITEVAHYKVATGAPTAGWPSYLLADDYIEITGVPGSDLGGITLEQWNATSMLSTHTFPNGTFLGPNGTAVIAVGQLTGSVPVPSSFYYHGNGTYTGTFASTGVAGRILKDQFGNIVDAVVYGNMAFPAAAGVSPNDWTGTTPSVSSSGNRLEGIDNNTSSNWINSGVSPQDPNVVNNNVVVPQYIPLVGLEWSLNGTVVGTDQILQAGPYTTSGTYTYIATYTNVCGTYSDTAIITVSLTEGMITSKTDVNCFGGNNGAATVSASGGNAPYTYNWSNGQTTATATGLTAGIYSVIVKDANQWPDTVIVEIEEPVQMQASIVVVDETCATPGSLEVNISGGNSPYTFTWNSGSPTLDNILLNLSAGSYSVTVTDADNCTVTLTENIGLITPNAEITSITNVSCNGGSNGEATVTITGGTLPYSNIVWNNSQTGAIATNLSAGTYTVTVTDAEGCVDTDTVEISEPTEIVVSLVNMVEPDCYGGNNGQATVDATGGIPPYSYSWLTGHSGPTALGLEAGSHMVVTTDNNGCVLNFSATVTQPAEIVANANITHVSCYGGDNGIIQVTATGGTNFYTYTWAGGHNGINLSAGQYTVTITDSDGCSVSASYTLNEPAMLDTSVTVSGVTLTTTLYDATYQWYNCTTNIPVDGATGQNFTPSADGEYFVQITKDGCTEKSSCHAIVGVGIQNHTAASNLKVYPNPNNGSFFITADKEGEFVLVNGLGQMVQKIQVTPSNKTEISGLAAGVYYLIGNKEHLKIVVTK
jgi:hypothetical protein